MFPRRSYTIFPLGFWFQWLTTVLVIAVILVSLWSIWPALRVLGKQWSLQARVLEDHKLVREGPYRFVRHPIYSAMLRMIVACRLAWNHWIGFLISLLLFGIGTAIRVDNAQ